VKHIRGFLIAIDAGWKPVGGEPVVLQVIGSAALMLQVDDYERGTKDSDILEAKEITPAVKKQLLALAGPKTVLQAKYGIYIEFVARAILFWPQKPIFHPVQGIPLKNFSIEVLDVLDVIVSKVKRLNQNDITDISAMAEKKLIDHKRLVNRCESAVDMFSTDARAQDIPQYIKNLNRVERDILVAPESKIALPDWMQ